MVRVRRPVDANTSLSAVGRVESPATDAVLDDNEVVELALRLLDLVLRVNTHEFYWQEAHYDHDSRQGRELLFLIANYEWACATSEIIDVSRSDAIDTMIKIDVDLDQITHEAFRARTGQIWLPVTILAPSAEDDSQRSPGHHYLEPDPFATVTDAAGSLLPLLPAADLRHQISAAMAEIIVNMATAHWPGAAEEMPAATRDERLLLSAAIYRLLRSGASGNVDSGLAGPELFSSKTGLSDAHIEIMSTKASPEEPAPRIVRAKEELARLLSAYIDLLDPPSGASAGEQIERGAPQFAPELARRAMSVLQALAESVAIVVPIDHDSTPTVLTVRVPARNMIRYSSWNLFRPRTWMIRPLARLEIDVLLATADADRQIQIHLPDGVCFDEPPRRSEKSATPFPRLDIRVKDPQPFQDLSAAMEQLLDESRIWPSALLQSFIDLTKVKVALALEALGHYKVAGNDPDLPRGRDEEETERTRQALTDLAIGLHQSDVLDDSLLGRLRTIWERFEPSAGVLLRRSSADVLSPRIAAARTEMIEDAAQRAVPDSAKIYLNITVDDRNYFSVARASTGMSLILMTAVFSFLVGWRLVNPRVTPAPEVLAIVLTLFAAIQAGRIERPDRATLHGYLSTSGNWLIAASMFPAVILSIVLAFRPGGWAAPSWAAGCIALQLALQIFMWRGPLAPGGSPDVGQRRLFRTFAPDYRHLEALRSNYWRSTTADALMIGRKAYAYVVWQRTNPQDTGGSAYPQLMPLLTWQPDSTKSDESTSILALLHAGTLRQSVTFVVFRGRPSPDWSAGAHVRAELDLDPSRLAPMESIVSIVDVFVGITKDRMLSVGTHPVVTILKTAAQWLMALEIQLPVPAPVNCQEGRQWARIRLALRDREDIRRLRAFLDCVYEDSAGADGESEHVVAIQTVPVGYPRVISLNSGSSQNRGDRSLILTDDLDVVNNSACVEYEDDDSCTWRLITIGADARTNIASDILQHLARIRPEYQLAGLTYGLLHGTALLIVLVHEPGADASAGNGQVHQAMTSDAACLERDLQSDPGLAKVRVLVDERLSRSELGPIAEYPLLRVRYRWQDHPGAFLSVLNSISSSLCEEVHSIQPDDWSVSYARIQVATGRMAIGRVSLRLHATEHDVESWSLRKMEEIERKVASLAAQEALEKQPVDLQQSDPALPDDLVISLDLIRRPR